VEFRELKKNFIKMCSELELEYCIAVRRLRTAEYLEEGKLLADPVLAYKIYSKDGREEPLRGVEFTGVSLRAVRDIMYASKENEVYNFYSPGPAKYNRGYVPTSIIAPSVLIQEMELKKTEKKPEKLTYLKNPYFEERK